MNNYLKLHTQVTTMRFFILCFIFLFYPLAASAEANKLRGVWTGTVGSDTVTACFNSEGHSGSYYYKRFLNPIMLIDPSSDMYWHEANETGLWELREPMDGSLQGIWRNPKTNMSFPIQLRLIDGKDNDKACALEAYNSALEQPPKLERGNIIQFSPGRSYRKLKFAGQETVELFAPEPAISRINAAIKLDQSPEAIDSYFQQKREFLGQFGHPEVDEHSAEPAYWDTNFITVKFYWWAAGYGTGGISNSYRTWNTITGEKVDLWQWIGSNSNEHRIPRKLYSYLFKRVRESPGCEEEYIGKGSFTLTLCKSGLNFDEDPLESGCAKSLHISYTKLWPFLSAKGKLAVGAILKSK